MPQPYSAKLIYNANGGSGAPDPQTMVVYQAGGFCTFVISTKKPTRSGYTFKGWATNSNATSPQFSNPATSDTQSSYSFNAGSTSSEPESTRTIYAVWQSSSNPYSATLKYNANGGTDAPDSQSASSSSPGSSSNTHTFTIRTGVPSKTGNTFLGWADSSSASIPKYSNPIVSTSSYTTSKTLTMQYGTSSSPNNKKTIYAVWSASTYEIRYRPGNYGVGSNVNQPKTHGVSVTLKGALFTREGYTQTGWSKNASGSTKHYNLGATYSDNATITLYPYWSTATYKVRYKPNGGSGSEYVQNVTYGENWTTYSGAGFSRPGYTLLGWAGNSSATSPSFSLNTTQRPWDRTNDLTLYAIWSNNAYSVTYKANGGVGSDYVQNVAYGQQWTTYNGAGFSRPGYRLIGWATSATGGVVFSLDRLQSAWNRDYNLTLYAVWETVSIVHVKTSSGLKDGVVYIKTDSGMKVGIVYVKGNDGNMHQNG